MLLYGFSHIIPLILIPYLINTIGIEKYGVINFALAFSFYFQVINEFGFDLSNVRHVVENRDNREKLSEILSAILQCKAYIIIVTGCIYLSTIFLFDLFREDYFVYLLAFIRILSIAITPFWFFRSMENLQLVTRIIVPVKFFAILPMFFVVKKPDDYTWVMFFFTLECVLTGLIFLFIAVKQYKLKIRWQRLSVVRSHFVDSIPFFTSTFVSRIYQTSNTVIIGLLFGNYAVGIYTTAEKLYFAYSSFVAPIISQVLYPYFQRIKDFRQIKKIIKITCIGNTILMLLAYMIMPYVINIVIKEAADQILLYFNLFLIVLVVYIPNELLGFPYIGIKGRIREVTYSSVWAAASYFAVIAVSLLFSPTIHIFIFALLIANVVGVSFKVYYSRK